MTRAIFSTASGVLLFLAATSLLAWASHPARRQTQELLIGRPVSVAVIKLAQRRASQRRREPRRGQQQPTPARIREIQQALIREGYLTGEPTGKWDAATREAMRRYQQAHGHPITGKPDALSLIKLGLGPKTAGQAAPRPKTSREAANSETSKVP